MTNDNTDTTDEPSKAELHERVEQLESTVEQLMPSRRDALKLGAAGIAGAAGLGATSQSVDASTGSSGQIGDPSNRPDLFADLVDANQLSGVSAGGIKTKTRAFLSSSSSADPVPFDSVSYDPDNNFNTSANEFVAPADGTYMLSFSVRLEPSVPSGSVSNFLVKVNGSKSLLAEITSSGNNSTVSTTDVQELTNGDSVTLGNGGGLALKGREASTFITIIRLE